jgi:hypothetical protein
MNLYNLPCYPTSLHVRTARTFKAKLDDLETCGNQEQR